MDHLTMFANKFSTQYDDLARRCIYLRVCMSQSHLKKIYRKFMDLIVRDDKCTLS